MTNQIYYLLDFHKKCVSIIRYGDDIIDKYCVYVNLQLDKYFTDEQQIQLKLKNFNRDLLDKFAYGDVENISFIDLDEIEKQDFYSG